MTPLVAARCAAMSSAIAQIILDATSFARQLRESRYYINAINADLLAIKLSLEIARDDFSGAGNGLPVLLVEAMAGFLDCCSASTESLHKPIVRLLAGDKRRAMWNLFSEGELQSIRQDLEALRSALDLVLDFVVLLHDSSDDRASSPPTKKCRIDGRSPNPENSVLKRIDIEREQTEALTEGRLPILYMSFDKLRASARILLNEQETTEENQKRSDSRSDSLEPEIGDQPRSARENFPPLASPASSIGIGAWLANVLSQKLHSHTLPPDALSLSDPRTSFRERQREREREGAAPSRETFYAESTTPGTRTRSPREPKLVNTESYSRTDSPQITVETSNSKVNRLTSYTTTTEISIIHQNLTNDKIAIAKDRRKQLTRSQRVTVDRRLRDISRTSTAVNVERIFFEGANPNVTHPEFGTLVIRAAYELPTEILKLLVDYGGDVTKTTRTAYYSALHAAVLGRHLENLQYLLSFTSTSTSDPSSSFQMPPTPVTSKFSVPTSSSIILSIDAPNANGETPLHLAARTPGAHHIAKWLLEMGADVNKETPMGESPLQVAVAKLDSRARSAMVQLLMAYGAEGEVEGESARQGGERRGKGLSILGLI